MKIMNFFIAGLMLRVISNYLHAGQKGAYPGAHGVPFQA